MKKLLVAVLLLSNVVLAQDVGEMLFRDVLRMNEYPGPPFTGRIIDDLVMFFLLPTVLIILVVYTLAGRMVSDPKLDLLLSIVFFLYIVVGGYFHIFAYFAGPYFFFMLFIVGVLLAFIAHFRGRPPGGRPTGFKGDAASSLENAGDSLAKQLVLKEIQLKSQRAGLDRARKANDPRTADYESRVAELEAEVQILQGEMRYNPAERATYQVLRQKYHV